jgi:TonB family protein
MSRASPLIRRLSVLFLTAFLTNSPALSTQDRDPKLEALADHLAQRLTKANALGERHGAQVTYLVFDFADTSGRTSQLGGHLADAVSEAMTNRLPGLNPIDRSKIVELYNSERIENTALRDDSAASWAAKTLGASLAILGTIEPRGEEFNLHLRVLDEHSKELTDAGGHLDWTEERRAWDRLPLSWPRPIAQRRDLPEPGRGYPEPVCVRCPSPQYTEAARKAKISGTILVEITVAEDGRVEDVIPLRGMPCGMTQQTVAAVKTWEYRPIIGPDGKPTRMRYTVELNFRIN